jgi:hypothetical protein
MERNSPFRSPSWLWAFAEDVVAGRRPAPDGEPQIGHAADYLRVAGSKAGVCDTPEGKRFTAIAAAHRLWTGSPITRGLVEGAILAGLDDSQVAAREGLTPATIRSFETHFFNVRDRLRARDWVVTKAIGYRPGDLHSTDDIGLAKAFGYSGGLPAFAAVDAVVVPGRRPAGGGWNTAAPAEVARVLERARDAVAVARLPADTPLDKLALVLEELRAGPKRGPVRPTIRRTGRTAPVAGGGRDRDSMRRAASTLQQGVLSLCGATADELG